MVEQSDTFTEQHGREVNLYFVKQPSLYVLLGVICTAQHQDVLVTYDCFCLPQGAFDTVSHAGRRRCSLGYLLWNLMTKDKYWHSANGMAT